MSEKKRTEETLVSRAKQGDSGAFSELVRLKMSELTAFTYKMTRDRQAALDLAQDSFIAAWKNLDSLKEAGKFSSWLYQIASNKSLNFIKQAKRFSSFEAVEPLFESDQVDSNPEKKMLRKELRDNMLDFMEQLPPQQKLAFELKFYKEMTFEEVSQITGAALGTVKTNYREAIKKLRETAIKKGWSA